MRKFRDRREAGQLLAEELKKYADNPDALLLCLPRGGVPVGHEIARQLHIPFDVFVVRKLGLPGHEELAMGAVASGGGRVLNQEVIRRAEVSDETIEEVARNETKELERREREYRGGRSGATLKNKTVILVDDGVATGSTMFAAIEAVRQHGPERLVVAVPTMPGDTLEALKQKADEVVAVMAPENFMAVGQWYENFSQTTDQEVKDILQNAREAA